MTNKNISLSSNMGIAFCSAVTTVNFTHPIDLVKTRLQVKNFNLVKMVKNEGILSLWNGLPAAWLREGTSTTVKLGCYGPIKEALGANNKEAGFHIKLLSGGISGTMGAVCGNPFDVLKTIGMANSNKNLTFPKLVKQIYVDRGIGGFYRGLTTNINRAIILNATKMACYDEIKSVVVRNTSWDRKDIRTQFMSGLGAGFFLCITVTPFDMTRTQIMNQPTNKKIYNGFTDAIIKIFKNEGPLAFYRGVLPFWLRAAPHTTLQLVIFDNLLNLSGLNTI